MEHQKINPGAAAVGAMLSSARSKFEKNPSPDTAINLQKATQRMEEFRRNSLQIVTVDGKVVKK